jgi:RNA polymerase sigma factor (sigma-70 family)
MTRNVFNDIIEKNNRKLFVIAYRILKNRQESEDVVQEVFLKMWQMKEKLDEYNDVTALAVTMTKNSCIDLLRKWTNISIEKNGSETLKEDPSLNPYEKLVRTEERDIISGIIDDLPDLWRDLVQMREINELSYQEIASRTGMNINNLRVALSRARQMIRDKYIRHSDERRKT